MVCLSRRLLFICAGLCYGAYGATSQPATRNSVSSSGNDIVYKVPGTRTTLQISNGDELSRLELMRSFLSDVANDVNEVIAAKGQYWPISRDETSRVTYTRSISGEWVRFEAGWYPPTGYRFFTWGRVADTVLGLSNIINSGERRVLEHIINVVDDPTSDLLGLAALSYRGPPKTKANTTIESGCYSNCAISRVLSNQTGITV